MRAYGEGDGSICHNSRAGQRAFAGAGVLSSYVRTAVLMSALIALLAIGGRAVGGVQGMLAFGAIGLGLNFVMYWFSDRIALLAHRAQEVSRAEAPTLFAIVERLTRRAGMPMPRIYLIPSASPNAFATGRNPNHAAVAVTDGICKFCRSASWKACWRTSCHTSVTAMY